MAGRTSPLSSIVLLLGPALLLGACDPAPSSAAKPLATRGPVESVMSTEPISPLPDPPALDPARVELGRRLFHDRRLSRGGDLACSTCHDLALGGTDRLPRSVRENGSDAPVNTPTVLNASLHFRWFWDGRAGSLEEQLAHATQDEMGLDLATIAERIRAVPAYDDEIERLYRGVSAEAIQDALVTFERSLVTPGSRFDRYLEGDESALLAAEREGYLLFKSRGCAACHQGPAVGANMYQRLGVFGDYFADRGHVTEADYGRYNVTGREEDRYVFKVPSLRNVALTPPYFHDASAETLEDAIRVMARYQLGRVLPDDEVAKIRAFLETLTGELDGVTFVPAEAPPPPTEPGAG